MAKALRDPVIGKLQDVTNGLTDQALRAAAKQIFGGMVRLYDDKVRVNQQQGKHKTGNLGPGIRDAPGITARLQTARHCQAARRCMNGV